MSTPSAARTRPSLRAAVRSVPEPERRVAATVVAALAVDQAFDPTHHHVPLCPLQAFTGIWCPFCGGLRSAYELTRLHIGPAIHDNLFVVAAAPVLAAWWIDGILRSRAGKQQRRIPRGATAIVVAALVLFTVVRNLPFGAALRGAG
jgi:Protein of unknown function (DUF2752)